MVSYVDAVTVVTMMHALLFVLNVCVLRECEGASVVDGVRLDVVSAGYEYVGGPRS